MSALDIDTLLASRIGLSDITRIVAWVGEDTARRDLLLDKALSAARRTSVNALWVMTHLPDHFDEWLVSLRPTLIDTLLSATDTSKRRLLLELLRRQEYAPDDIRTDLLDYCLTQINAESQPYAIRCFSLYLAFKMCRHYPELIAELSLRLDLLSQTTLSPGLRSALRQTRRNISRLP